MRRFATLAIVALLLITGCGPSFKRTPLPATLADVATVPGVIWARDWGDVTFADEETPERVRAFVAQVEASGIIDHPQNWLALSGGGQNGAFGAGLLTGWTERGDRPEFSRVTGVSTGALMAPFAFLGSEYDHILESVYTGVSTRDIIRQRGVINALTSDALASTKPLRRLIAEYLTEDIVDAIAREHRRGRRLLILTTNLDALRPVAWNIGQIATSERADRVELIRNILLASASIPGAMPPVYFEVEANGRIYDEMHVDGGATAQIYTYPGELDASQIVTTIGLQAPTFYIIRNDRLAPDWQTVKPRIGSIALRALGSIVRTQGLGDLYLAYALFQRDGFEFRLAYIPDDFTLEPKETFDPLYMTALFENGRRAILEGDPWEDAPPGYNPRPPRIEDLPEGLADDLPEERSEQGQDDGPDPRPSGSD